MDDRIARPHRPPRTSRVAEAALCRARAPWRVVRAVRRHARRVQQRRGAARAALFQPGQSERLRPRPRARGAAGARLHALAGAPGRARPERRRRLRARAEQERAGDAAARRSASTAPRSITFNDVERAAKGAPTTCGGPRCSSRIRAAAAHASRSSSRWIRSRPSSTRDPSVWLPDNLFLLQEYLPHDPDQGIVRLEFLGGELLYAMRVKTHGHFNLCPSPVCNPDEGGGECAIPESPVPLRPGRVLPLSDAPPEAIDDRPPHRPRRRPRRRRHRVPRNDRRPARLLRHQRQLEPAAIDRGGLGLRSLRAGSRLPDHPNPRPRTLSRLERKRPVPLEIEQKVCALACPDAKARTMRLCAADEWSGVSRRRPWWRRW